MFLWFRKIIISIYQRLPAKVQKYILMTFSTKDQSRSKKIELINGEVIDMSGFQSNIIMNKVSFQKSRTYIKSLIRYDMIMQTVYFIITANIQRNEYDVTFIIQLIIFILNVLINVVNQTIKRNNYKYIEKQFNLEEYVIVNSFQQHRRNIDKEYSDDYNTFFHPQKKIQAQNIKVGDVVILQNNQTSPADLLILDASQPQVMVDQGNFSATEIESRHPCQSTFSNNINLIFFFTTASMKSATKGLLIDFKLGFNGKILYDYRPGRKDSLTGSVKLKNDPKLFKFNEENVIYAGEKTYNSDWMLGIVLVAGNQCLRLFKQQPVKEDFRTQFIIIIFILLAYLLSVINYVDGLSTYGEQLSFNIIIIPQFLVFFEGLSILYIHLQNKYNNNTVQQLKKMKKQNETQQRHSILTQDDKKVVMNLKNVSNLQNDQINSKKKIKLSSLENVQQQKDIILNSINLWEGASINCAIIEIDRWQMLKASKVRSINFDTFNYSFKYQQIRNMILNGKTQFSDNYQKNLIDTGRDVEMYEEKQNYDSLIQPQVILSNPTENNSSRNLQSILIKNTLLNDSMETKKKKISVDGSDNKKISLLGRHFSSKKVIVKNQIGYSQQMISPSFKTETEALFISKLFDSQDNTYHEKIVSMMLLTQFSSKFNPVEKRVEVFYAQYDDRIISRFGAMFEYKLKCCFETERVIYERQQQINIKILEIQGKLKQYELLSENVATNQRPNTYSILLKDPEGFNDDEGALVYIRIESQELEDLNRYNLNFAETNQILYNMMRQGQKSVLYLKKQISKSVAMKFLIDKDTILESVSPNQNAELEKLYLNLEQGADLMMILGLHSKVQKEFIKQINGLQNTNIQPWLVSSDSYFEVIRFLYESRIVYHEDDLVIFNYKDDKQLKFAIQIQCSNLIKQNKILEILNIERKTVVISGLNIQYICKDNYLLNHFCVIMGFYRSMAVFDSNEISKRKLRKIIEKLSLKCCFIGSGINNQRVFVDSEFSIDIQRHHQPFSMNNSNIIASSYNSIDNMLMRECIKSNELASQIVYYLIYSTTFATIVQIMHSNMFQSLSQIMVILISNLMIIPLIIIEHKAKYQELHHKSFDYRIQNQRQFIEPFLYYTAFIRIFSITLIDSLIIALPLYVQRYLYGDSNYLPVSEVGFIMAYELIQKIQLLYQLEFYNGRLKCACYLLLNAILVIIISFFSYPPYSDFTVTYADYFYSPGSIIRSFIFVYLFSFVFKIATITIFQIYGLECFTKVIIINEDDYKEILQLKSVIQAKYSTKSFKEMWFQFIMDYRKKFIQNIIGEDIQMEDTLYKALNNDQTSDQQIEMSSDLRFQKEIEQKYQLQKYEKKKILFSVQLIISCVFFEGTIFINLLIQIKNQGFLQNNITLIVIWGVLAFISCLYFICAHFQLFSIKSITRLKFIQTMYRVIFTIISVFIINEQNPYNFILFISKLALLLSVFMNLHTNTRDQLIAQIFIGLSCVIRFSVPPYYSKDQGQIIFIIYGCLIIQILIMISTIIFSYCTEYLRRQFFILSDQLDKEQKKLNDILGLLMPKFIKERMARGHIMIQEDQGPVTILFCDICEFDDIIEEHNDIIGLLDNMYRAFDSICNQCNVQKIETVGKTYLCAAGLKDYDIIDKSSKSCTQRILECAINMMEVASSQKYGEDAKNIVIKIGINYGQVMAGVIGSHKPQFSLIGDTVNTTSRVCSTGQYGKITLSESAFMRIKHLNKYQFSIKKVEAKGKGVLNTYQLHLNKHKNDQVINDKQAKIRFANSIHMKKEDRSSSPPEPLSAALNPYGNQLKDNNILMYRGKLDKSIGDMITNVLNQVQPQHNKINEQMVRRHTTHRKTRMTKVRDPGILKQSNIAFSVRPYGLQNLQVDQIASSRKHSDMFDGLKVVDSQKNIEIKEKKSFKNQDQQLIQQNQDEQQNKQLFESQSQNDDKVELAKMQLLVGNSERIDVEEFQELIKLKCDNVNFSNQSYHIQIEEKYETLLSIYTSKIFQDLKYYCLFLSLMINLYQVWLYYNTLYLYTLQLGISILLLTVKIALWFFLLIIIPIYFKETTKFVIHYGLVAALFLQQLSSLLGAELNQNVPSIYQSFSLSFCQAFYLYIRCIIILNNTFKYIICALNLIYTIIFISFTGTQDESLIFILSSEVLLHILQYLNMKQIKKNYLLSKNLERQKNQQQNVVNHLLPSHILSNFMKSIDSPTDYFENATILFADIAGFTKYSSSVEASQVLSMLSSLFNQLDQSCASHQVYKLYTIGDCYVVLGIVDALSGIREEEAFNVINFAFSMIDIINQVRKNLQYSEINMRIGIHTGTIKGGIVGTDIVRYDIYGEDVGIANKMESNGQEGKIMVSEDTKDFVQSSYSGFFNFIPGRLVKTRRRDIQGYFVELISDVED